MSIASVSTITAGSPLSWQDATERGLERARKTLRHITGMEVVEERARVVDGDIVEFQVTLRVVFELEENGE